MIPVRYAGTRLRPAAPGRQQEGDRQAEREHGRRTPQTGRHAADLGERAGQKDADQPPGGIGGIVEADILGGLLRAGIGQDQVGVQRRDHGERRSRTPAGRRPGPGRDAPHARRDSSSARASRDGGQNRAPEPGVRAPRGSGRRGCASPRRCQRLDAAVADGPGREEAGDLACSASRARRGTPAGRRRTRRRARRTGRCAPRPAG